MCNDYSWKMHTACQFVLVLTYFLPLVKQSKMTVFALQHKEFIELAHSCLLFWDWQAKKMELRLRLQPP